MGEYQFLSRQEACRYLAVREDATQEEIKKAYHMMAKQYHPDVNRQADTSEIYRRIQEAYEYLLTHPYTAPIIRQPRIFQTDSRLREKYRKQKDFAEERKKSLERAQAAKKQAKRTVTPPHSHAGTAYKTEEEEALAKIRAIWLAETIRRQIELDKAAKEASDRKKLYQAFMQQRINEEEEQKQGKE